MGARQRVRQTGKVALSLAVHAQHNRHDVAYTWQQFEAEQRAVAAEMAERAARRAQREAADDGEMFEAL